MAVVVGEKTQSVKSLPWMPEDLSSLSRIYITERVLVAHACNTQGRVVKIIRSPGLFGQLTNPEFKSVRPT